MVAWCGLLWLLGLVRVGVGRYGLVAGVGWCRGFLVGIDWCGLPWIVMGWFVGLAWVDVGWCGLVPRCSPVWCRLMWVGVDCSNLVAWCRLVDLVKEGVAYSWLGVGW